MKILIVSDTHGKDENLEAAVYKEAPFDLLIHCGDVEGREIFTEALVDCPCCMVSGNNDFFTDLPREEQIELCGKRILVTHGHYYGVSMGHEEIVEKVEGVMPDEQQLLDLSEFFKIFGDSTRIKILYVLSQSEMCVCDIATLLQMGQSAISHQLKALKNARLVKSRRDGKTVFYSLADDHVKTIIDQGLEHILE